MILMSIEDIKFILMGLKWITMRGLRSNNKGYLKINSIQSLKLNLFGEWIIKVKIINREFVDLNEMDEDDFKGVGYDMGEYLSHSYNIKNPSSMRVKYSFKIVDVNEELIRELFNGF